MRRDKSFYLTVDPNKANDSSFQSLREALKDYYGNPGSIAGRVHQDSLITWSEAVELSLEGKNENLWLMISPTIWINPSIERRNNVEFIKRKKLKRYNQVSNNLLNAWIKILFNVDDLGKVVEIGCFKDSKYPIKFKVNTRTAYSRK